MSFFSNMNLARFIILGSVLGSCALGWYSWKRQGELEKLRAHLDQDVPLLVKGIQELSVRHSELMREMNSDKFQGGQSDPIYYITSTASADNIELGRVTVNPSKSSPRKGVTDHKFRVTPADKARGYDKARIANFMYKLEEASRRVRVTNMKIETTDRRLPDNEVPSDRWTFDLTITSRQQDDEAQ